MLRWIKNNTLELEKKTENRWNKLEVTPIKIK